ncbi:uncharacterized protein BHQ10_003853 [Talaromyces amestolkiae]|uniref:Uncharacterized protein n=1 Tax=Talaromyces amestolkiae TaxID=1196081 RepID=A0A364KWG6_TALAM|nr:uncharacterized protein BHQ10_003853 [Talaromyces amestolkiae]RAO67841.1 hypothetical protein BHQ10_003853 [Talaromyces amestolkiae]
MSNKPPTRRQSIKTPVPTIPPQTTLPLQRPITRAHHLTTATPPLHRTDTFHPDSHNTDLREATISLDINRAISRATLRKVTNKVIRHKDINKATLRRATTLKTIGGTARRMEFVLD